MKQHTTNYIDTFIEVAEDCSAIVGEPPPDKEPKTAARIEYDMVIGNPYRYTSDDVLYASGGNRRGISREEFFSKASRVSDRPHLPNVTVGAYTATGKEESRFTRWTPTITSALPPMVRSSIRKPCVPAKNDGREADAHESRYPVAV